LAGIGVLLLVLVGFYRNNRNKEKANLALELQKKRVEETLAELKSTQVQLIQSEKMASLGELTAGIAHEIQNPLNFVNNFSDLNTELIQDLKSEIQKGNLEEVKALASDIELNEVKINHHGKRAEGIVKSMLQHSQKSSGQKELTDINALCDEYLRLAFHGYRAKDKSFNAKFELNIDTSLPKIHVAPQDIGRVVLNLINNAFYAVSEKQKQNLNGYQPVVTVSTAKQNGKLEIKVIDNGNGIPKEIIEKIFLPFFTTKPAGQGTGLGLSLAYDIITKGHGGTIEVTSDDGKGTEFTIYMPSES
jgi:two-component system, NtrC family, sensor kinase